MPAILLLVVVVVEILDRRINVDYFIFTVVFETILSNEQIISNMIKLLFVVISDAYFEAFVFNYKIQIVFYLRKVAIKLIGMSFVARTYGFSVVCIASSEFSYIIFGGYGIAQSISYITSDPITSLGFIWSAGNV